MAAPEEGGRLAAKLHILQHALGVDQHGRGGQYRSHFVTGEGSDDYAECMALVADGLMSRRDGKSLPLGGMDLFNVTDEGRAFVAAYSPPAPKLTRSQRRYQAYLDADSGVSFRDYLRSGAAA